MLHQFVIFLPGPREPPSAASETVEQGLDTAKARLLKHFGRVLPIIIAELEFCNIERHIFESSEVNVRDYPRNHIALAADRADDWRFAGTDTAGSTAAAAFVPMPVLGQAADESFINFDDPAELINVLHQGHADLVTHGPSCLIRTEAHIALDLQRAHALLAGQHQVDNAIPIASALSDVTNKALKAEIAALQGVRPHAVITTNYDRFLELIFPEYQPVIGQNIIHGTQVLFGEIFKIHGCVSDRSSLVFTQSDFDEFTRKKKYLSAKLLTYFSEHPLLFVGYSASDPNIRAILSDIDECIPRRGPPGAIIPNIYILEWRAPMPQDYVPAREKLIEIDEGRSLRINAIETDDFRWVFSAFGTPQPLNAVSPKLLRALLHRSDDSVRHDIPRQTVHADFEMLERAVKTDTEFAKLFGITTVNKAFSHSVDYPYTLTDLAEKVTGKKETYWAAAQLYIDRIKTQKKVDIKKSEIVIMRCKTAKVY